MLDRGSMEDTNKKKDKQRPYRMRGVPFPPAKYGLFAAIAFIIIFFLLQIFG